MNKIVPHIGYPPTWSPALEFACSRLASGEDVPSIIELIGKKFPDVENKAQEIVVLAGISRNISK